MKTRKLLSVLLMLCMVFTLLPAFPLTAGATDNSYSGSGGTLYFRDGDSGWGLYDTMTTGGNLVGETAYTATERRLEFTSDFYYDFTGDDGSNHGQGLAIGNSATPVTVVINSNVAFISSNTSVSGIAIASNGTLTIEGTGTLTAIGSQEDCTGNNNRGISLLQAGNLTISGVTVNATAKGANLNSYGISVFDGNITISNGATVNASAGQATNSYGIIISNNGNITITDSTVTAYGVNDNITANGSINITGGTFPVALNEKTITALNSEIAALLTLLKDATSATITVINGDGYDGLTGVNSVTSGLIFDDIPANVTVDWQADIEGTAATALISLSSVSGHSGSGFGTFNMTGGSITGTSNTTTAIYNMSFTLNISGGKISTGGIAVNNVNGTVNIGGNAEVMCTGSNLAVFNNGGTVTVNDGVVAATGNNSYAIFNISGDVIINGGLVFSLGGAIGDVISGSFNPTGGVIVAWDMPTAPNPTYTSGAKDALTFFTANEAVWNRNASGVGGLSYADNKFFPVDGVTVNVTITEKAIQGVTPPVTGGTPVTTITPTAQYTGVVTWNPNHSTFEPETAYLAEITLTAKDGYTLTGVPVNFFTVAGADVYNFQHGIMITAVFPLTAAAPVCSHTWVSNNNGTHKCTSATNPCNVTSETCSPNSAGATCTKCGYKTPTGGNGGNYYPPPSVSASISPRNADFDKYGGGDIAVTLNRGSYTLGKLINGSYTLINGTDYTVSGNTYTIKTAYLQTLDEGAQIITFDMSGGTDPKLTIAITDTTPPPPPDWINPFIDVTENDWFYEAVKYAHQNGLVVGTTPTTFSPQMTMTRGMMVMILYNHAGKPQAGGAAFSDVRDGAWYADAVNWAAANGIVSGYGNGKFGANDEITREQMAVIFYNYARFIDAELPKKRIGAFIDDAQISRWAKEAVDAMYAAEILNGKGQNDFDPQGISTRAEVVAMMKNFLECIGG